MNYFRVKLSLNDSGAQPKLMQKLKADGGDVIQTSDGVCLKTQQSAGALAGLLKELDIAAAPEPVDSSPDAAQDLPQDIRAFLSA